MMSRIVKLRLFIGTCHVPLLNTLVSHNTDTIIQFVFHWMGTYAHARTRAMSSLSSLQLQLSNPDTIFIPIGYFNFEWSSKCQTLGMNLSLSFIIISYFEFIYNWYDYVVNDCDCSGIQGLHITSVKSDR